MPYQPKCLSRNNEHIKGIFHVSVAAVSLYICELSCYATGSWLLGQSKTRVRTSRAACPQARLTLCSQQPHRSSGLGPASAGEGLCGLNQVMHMEASGAGVMCLNQSSHGPPPQGRSWDAWAGRAENKMGGFALWLCPSLSGNGGRRGPVL